ncbi:hypothetical protein KJ766_02035 [Patescibacteria group bacterium]|nr:hypothetical protein [Patescibacteria group bacterium]
MSKDILQKLKGLQTDPNAGWAGSDLQKKGRLKLMQAISGEDSALRENVTPPFYRWSVIQFISMPATIVATGFVLIFGGSMTTVTAASNSLPGDALYGIKMITEQTKLKFSSLENKAVLHTEFAERRLQEAVALEARGEVDSVQVALDAFKTEMQAASSDLQKLQSEGRTETLAVAATIDGRIEELNASVTHSDDSVDTAAQVATVTKEASNSVVNVVVEEHEVSATQQSESDLHSMFKNEYNAMNSRKTFDLGRVSVISEVISLNELDLDFNSRALENDIKEATKFVPDAMNFAAQGGYRKAFELLREADTNLLELEAQLASIEFDVMQAMTPQVQEEVVEQQEIINNEIQTEEETIL